MLVYKLPACRARKISGERASSARSIEGSNRRLALTKCLNAMRNSRAPCDYLGVDTEDALALSEGTEV